jgi:hypothetical protein
LETRNAGVTAKGSNAKREAFAFVDDQETLAADFVSDWSDGHLIGFLFEVLAFGNHFRLLKRDSRRLTRTPRKIVKYIFSPTRLFY